jgi:hypothetical protein
MNKGILISCIIVLLSFIFIEYAVFIQLSSRHLTVQEKYNISRDYNKDTDIKESSKTSLGKYGYGGIMEVLKYERNLKILRIEKINEGDNNIAIGFEFIGSEGNFKRLSMRLNSMENFIGINKLFIKDTDDGNKNIQFYTEFRISYAK